MAAVLTSGFLESILLSGSIYGWASLVYVFKVDGIFNHLCVSNNYTDGLNTSTLDFSASGNESITEAQLDCAPQDSMLNLAYTMGLACNGILSFPLGWIFDKAGMRTTRILAW